MSRLTRKSLSFQRNFDAKDNDAGGKIPGATLSTLENSQKVKTIPTLSRFRNCENVRLEPVKDESVLEKESVAGV
jgi:hypothetical protein